MGKLSRTPQSRRTRPARGFLGLCWRMRISRTPVKPTTSCCARGQSTPAPALLATSAKIDEEFSPADPVGRNGWAPLGIDDGKTVRSNQREHTTYLKNIKILLHCSLADYHGAVEECPAGVGAGRSLQPARWLLTHSHRDGRHLEFCCSAAYSHVVQFTAGFSGFYFGLGNPSSTSCSVRPVTTPFIDPTSWPSQSTAPNDCGTA